MLVVLAQKLRCRQPLMSSHAIVGPTTSLVSPPSSCRITLTCKTQFSVGVVQAVEIPDVAIVVHVAPSVPDVG